MRAALRPDGSGDDRHGAAGRVGDGCVAAGPDAVGVALRPVRAADAFEATVEHLATAIRVGAVPRGEYLPPERELALRLGVARSTLREAISALRDAGMVRTSRGRGGGSVVVFDGGDRVVTRPEGGASAEPETPRGTHMLDILDFRRVVEPGSAALAATRTLEASQRACLVAALHDVTDASRRDPGEHRVADSRFHVAVAELTGSAPLIEAVSRGRATMHRLLTDIPVFAANMEHSNAEHAVIVDAVLAGDAERARRVSEEHCDKTSALLRGLLP